MTYPDDKRKIAVKLLLPPLSLNIAGVAFALEVPYQTIRNWKIKAEAGQEIDKRQRKSTKTTTGVKRASLIKIESSTTASKETRQRTRSNEQSRVAYTQNCIYKKSNRLAEDYKN